MPSKYLLFVHDIKTFRAVNSANDCTLMQSWYWTYTRLV